MPLRPKHRALWLLPPRGQPLTSPVGQVTLKPVRLLESAYRNGVSASDIRHAAANAIRHHDLNHGLVMLVGPDTTGALLEVGTIASTPTEPPPVHALPARAKLRTTKHPTRERCRRPDKTMPSPY